jgi:hypothetical protein
METKGADMQGEKMKKRGRKKGISQNKMTK